jgi:hypothetical protein
MTLHKDSKIPRKKQCPFPGIFRICRGGQEHAAFRGRRVLRPGRHRPILFQIHSRKRVMRSSYALRKRNSTNNPAKRRSMIPGMTRAKGTSPVNQQKSNSTNTEVFPNTPSLAMARLPTRSRDTYQTRSRTRMPAPWPSGSTVHSEGVPCRATAAAAYDRRRIPVR